MNASLHRFTAATLALLACGLAAVCAFNSLSWIGRVFPGFFVMDNRVIASASLPGWPGSSHAIFQSEVIAVDGIRVSSGREIYAVVKKQPGGVEHSYTLARDGYVTIFRTPAQRFSIRDYCLIFAPYLASGLSLALIGVVVWYTKPQTPASLALLLGGLGGGVFAITASDLYSPYWFFRLHVATEAFYPAALLVHLAIVFPVDRLRGRRWRPLAILVPYALATLLTAAYEIFLFRPAAYSLIHNLCMDATGVGGALLLAAVAWDFFTSQSELVRQRVRVLLLGFLCGFAFPGALMLYSGLTGGQTAVNYAGFTVVLFPLSIGYAIVQHDLFEIDALIKRSVYYLTITAALGAAYAIFLLLTDWSLSFSAIAHWRLFPFLFTIVVAFLLNPVRDGLQRTVDRVFFRLRYNPKEMLEASSAALAATLELAEIADFVWNTIGRTVGVRVGGVFIRSRDHGSFSRIHPDTGDLTFAADDQLILALRGRCGEALSRYDLESPPGTVEGPTAFDRLSLEVAVPMLLKDELIGFIALGRKESGKFFAHDDITFLHALANQTALSIANALAYNEIRSLNAVLEQRVAERTSELSVSNSELQLSLERLGIAYRDLQQSQEDLSRAEKMATLGRLAAGIAHEMNTPLGASMTNLKLLSDLVDEYRAATDDAAINPEDHREIATDMRRLVSATRDWLNKAGAHIRSLKLHTRALQTRNEQAFAILDVIEDVRLLLAHRLRETQGSLVVHGGSTKPVLYGDAAKFAQVLTNLVTNAIDANAGRPGSMVEVTVDETADEVMVTVRDHGPGIVAENLPHIFDDFFSTKRLGEGTGLGLPIARDIVSNFFRGTIAVDSTLGDGATFTLRCPRRVQPGQRSVAA